MRIEYTAEDCRIDELAIKEKRAEELELAALDLKDQRIADLERQARNKDKRLEEMYREDADLKRQVEELTQHRDKPVGELIREIADLRAALKHVGMMAKNAPGLESSLRGIWKFAERALAQPGAGEAQEGAGE